MSGSEAVFVAIGIIGFAVLLISLVLGELGGHGDFGGHGEIGHETEVGHGEVGHGDVGHGDVSHGEIAHGIDGSPAVSHEIGHEIGHEVAHGAAPGGDLHTPSWFSTRVIAASFVGFGAAGYVAAAAGAPAWISWPVAASGLGAVGAGSFWLILKPLARQQYNSLMSRYNYVGCRAVVTLGIEAGGTGQVTFRDRQGARVNQTARSDLGGAVDKGVAVQIVDIVPGGVVVHHNQFSL